MTPQDREQFRTLALRQARLEEALTQLRTEFKELERRAKSHQTPTELIAGIPPLPAVIKEPARAEPPPLPIAPVVEEQAVSEVPDPLALPGYPTPRAVASESVVPEAPPVLETTQASAEQGTEASTAQPPLPEIPSTPQAKTSEEEKQGGLEFQFGRWLARIGVVFALITLISFSTLAYKQYHHLMGPWSKLGVLSLISVGLVVAGLRIERKNLKLTVYARTLAGGGLACLYYTLYGATYVSQLHVISSPLFGGFLLLGWSAYVLYLAEKKKSELLSVFAIALAYFSSAITPVGGFTMAANLILSLTAVIFLVRNAWTGLSYLCLIGTYMGLLRQFAVYDGASHFWFEIVHGISFWPAATYLAGAWVIYTAGVFLSTTPNFAAGKRMAFLCLNNGALIGLLTLASYLSAFGHIGAILCVVGGLFLGTSYLARRIRTDADEVAGAYLMQGLALATGGLVIAYSGVTRGLLITVESVFLVAAGAFSKNRIFRIAGRVGAILGTGYLIDEIGMGNHFPWVLTIGGAAAMLANAWLARRDFWHEPREVAGARFVFSSAYYILLASGLLVAGIVLHAHDAWVAPDLAFAALALTLVVYLVPLFELPLLSQGLLVLAQIISFVPPMFGPPASQGTSLGSYAEPQWSQNIVALVTMALVTWWPRQKIVRTGFWLQPLTLLYALAMVGFCFNAVHPRVDAQGWMVAASFLSLVFLAYGAWTRTWQFMVSGQIYLALAIWIFFNPPGGISSFPWTWWAAALPPAVVFLSGWLAHQWLPRFLKLSKSTRECLSAAAYFYQAFALGLAVRWIFGIIPAAEDTLAFFLLAMGLLLWNMRWPSAFGARAGLVINLVGAANYLFPQTSMGLHSFTWADAVAFVLFLAQPAILRRWGRELVSEWESWAVILISAGMGWLFVSHSIDAAGSHNLTLGWALFAVALTVVGFILNERRQRWCGLVILLAAIIRVGVYDFWGFSDLYKVLTFFVLTVICLGLSFLYYKFADRLKEWL